MLTIAAPLETANDEQRVALVPDVVQRLSSAHDLKILIEKGAGERAYYSDEAYAEAGAEIVDAQTLYSSADLLVRVSPPAPSEVEQMKSGTTLISFLIGADDKLPALLAKKNITALAMERIPRTTRAQSMDALSSQRSVAGYRAVLLAAGSYWRFLPMLSGPTGTIRPATVLIIGAGVAGLQAIATARRLGAVVEVSDIRSASKEQVESLGAKFVGAEFDAEAEGGYARELTAEEKQQQADQLARHVGSANIVITTAEIPNRRAPQIVSQAMVENMVAGSLLIDLAAASGGNCELTQLNQWVEHQGVRIFGPANMAAQMPSQSSDLYAKNILNLLGLLIKENQLAPNWEDDILAALRTSASA